MTTRATRRKKLPLAPVEKKELTLKDFIKALYKSEVKIHIQYILIRLAYIFQTLLIAWIMQYVWNSAMIKWFDGDYQMGIFEAAILWICVY